MFISKAEKESIYLKIRALDARVKDLEIETTWLRNKATRSFNSTMRSPEAPWGLKRDGSPRKRPGRPIQLMEVGS